MLHTITFHIHFSNFGFPELNRTALANAATVSEHLHDILPSRFLRYRAMQVFIQV